MVMHSASKADNVHHSHILSVIAADRYIALCHERHTAAAAVAAAAADVASNVATGRRRCGTRIAANRQRQADADLLRVTTPS